MKILTLILNSGKCSWKNCYACGWGKLEYPLDMEQMKKKVESASYEDVELVKVFCSGSFLDDAQFTKEFRKWFCDFLKSKKIKKLTVESRPEFITQKNLDDFKDFELTVAIGLESAVDSVLTNYKKGFTYADYLKAVEVLHKNKMKVRTYLMANIPFGTKKQFDDSVKKVLPITDQLVLINTFPHSNAELFNDWISGKWKPLNEGEFNEWVAAYKSDKIETDAQNYAFKPKFPRDKMQKIVGANSENLNHPYFNVWQDYFQRFYKRPAEKNYCLFLPCSFKKPYTFSDTHKKIYGTLRGVRGSQKFHSVVVSNPGAIPLEFCDNYPLNNYDWPEWDETPELMKEYVEVLKNRIKEYLKWQKYDKVFAFLKYTQTWEAVEKACKELKIPVVNLLGKETFEKLKEEKNLIISKEALNDLVKNSLRYL